MLTDDEPGDAEELEPAASRGGHFLRLAILGAWAAAVWFVVLSAVVRPTAGSIVVAVAFVLLFVIVNAQLLLLRWAANRNWIALMTRLNGAAYYNDVYNLPNRNYLLSELRREMPRARRNRQPFVLVQLSLDTYDEVRARRGDDFIMRAARALTDLVKRISRETDFVAHVGEGKLCVLLMECRLDQAYIFLERVPSIIAVSDGRDMLDVPVMARLHEYDLEALYATDVVREVEDAKPLRRREEAIERDWSQVA